MLSRFFSSAAFDNDRLVVQQSEICSLKQEEILIGEQVSIKLGVQFITV